MIAELRKKIDENGFAEFGEIAEVASDAYKKQISDELVRLGYEVLYIPDENKTRVVVSQNGKTPQEALDWLISQDIENGIQDVFNNALGILENSIIDIDRLHINVRNEFEFDYSNPNWVPNSEHTLFFLGRIESMYKDRVKVRDIFMNEILDTLGIPRTQSGQFVGWRKGENLVMERELVEDGIVKLKFRHFAYMLDSLGN